MKILALEREMQDINAEDFAPHLDNIIPLRPYPGFSRLFGESLPV